MRIIALLKALAHDLVELLGRGREDAAAAVEDVGVFEPLLVAEPLLDVAASTPGGSGW